MSKLMFKTACLAAFCSSAVLASNINLSAKSSADGPWQNAVSVGRGEVVPIRIEGLLTDTLNDGLALIGFDLRFVGPSPSTTVVPLSATTIDELPVQSCASPAVPPTCANPMPSFMKNLGITNPAGFKGTLIGGVLVQIGGGGNSIKNVAANADFPCGAVITNIAQGGAGGCPPNGPAIIATGSITAPMVDGTYTLHIENPFANVIRDGESGNPFYATEAAGAGTMTPLSITVQSAPPPNATKWESVMTHARTGVNLGELALEITADGNFVEPRQGMRKIVISFDTAITPGTAIPANIQVAGRDVNQQLLNLSGHTIGVTPTAGNTKMEITFTPPLPDFARYRVTLNGVGGAGGNVATGGQRFFTALLGDATNNKNVQTNDVGGCRNLVAVAGTQIDPLIATHIRCDATLDARITTQDVGGIRSKVGNNATAITNP